MSWSPPDFQLAPYRTRRFYHSDWLDESFTVSTKRHHYYPIEESSYHRSRHEKGWRVLTDRERECCGDFGWSLDYATAWCFKHLVHHRAQVINAIDRVRELGLIAKKTPFVIFDLFDEALFGGKLAGAVYMQWNYKPSTETGTTFAPGVYPRIKRICITLNGSPFEDDMVDPTFMLEYLLDALIHQMIHAYFLVACGAQPLGAQQDGRLMDGVEFGVILKSIKDLTRECAGGEVPLIFYAEDRMNNGRQRYLSQCRGSQNRFIALSPLSSSAGPAPVDGKSHCCHDNRRIRPAQVKNWQVEHYSRALNLDQESKGDYIHDYGIDNKFSKKYRVMGPPSASYVELIYDGMRVMVPRDNAMRIVNLKRLLVKNERMELKVPECSMDTFTQLYNYLTIGSYTAVGEGDYVRGRDRDVGIHGQAGPPIIAHIERRGAPEVPGMITHIRVFKVAVALEFEELQKHAVDHLYRMPIAYDDPINALHELYNMGSDQGAAIHADLHQWVRAFLARSDNVYDVGRNCHDWQGGLPLLGPCGQQGLPGLQRYGHLGYLSSFDASPGSTNYKKLHNVYHERFLKLYYNSPTFKDDCKLVVASMHDCDVPSPYPMLDYPCQPETAAALPQLGMGARLYQEPLLRRERRRRSNSDCMLPPNAGYPVYGPALLEYPSHEDQDFRRRGLFASLDDQVVGRSGHFAAWSRYSSPLAMRSARYDPYGGPVGY